VAVQYKIDGLITPFLLTTTTVAAMPRLLKKYSQCSSPPPIEEPGLVAVADLPSSRRPYGSKNLVVGVEGRISTQAGVFAQILGPDLNMQAILRHTGEAGGGEDSSEGEDSLGGEGDIAADDGEELEGGVQDEGEARKRAGKKERQWRNWSEVMIPAMLEPYMELLRESESLRSLGGARNHKGCQGCEGGRLLEVVCVYFESMFAFLWYYFQVGAVEPSPVH
jgi:hypothetical protein